MAFISSGLNLTRPHGLAGTLPGEWIYRSSDSAVTIAATGYFAKQGAGSRWPSSMAHSTSGARVGPAGLKVGDIVLNVESSAGATPGRVTLHAVTASTADNASTSASTGFATAYDCTVSAHAST